MIFALSASFSYGLLAGDETQTRAPAAFEVAALVPAVSAEPPRAPKPEPLLDAVVSLAPKQSVELVRVARKPERSALLDGGGTLKVRTGHVSGGSTLGSTLRKHGVEQEMVERIIAALRPGFDFRRAQPGDFFALISDESDRILSFDYQHARGTVYHVKRGPDDMLHATREEPSLERRVVQIGGTVERSLFESITALGEQGELAQDFADVFVWDFDFSTQTRPGDGFSMVVEKLYDRDGFVSYGKILAAQYQSGVRDFTAIYFEDESGQGDYYTPDGKSVRRNFLRAPLKYTRISSHYTKSRFHPVLKMHRPHEGVDYAAPHGTPVWAIADGVVTFKGWNGGFGRLIKVRHSNGYTSHYGHLASFASGIQVGSKVRQKQMIGRVGASGLCTGPHLDYRVQVNGRFVDPLRVRFPIGQPVPVKARERFEEVREQLLAELREAQPPLLEAAM